MTKPKYRIPVLREYYPKQVNYEKSSHRLSKRFLLDNRITEDFLDILASLKLEEIIALKLEITSRLYGGKLFGFSLWAAMPDIVKESLFKYATFCSNSKKEAIMLLGIDSRSHGKLLARYKDLDDTFNEEREKNEKSFSIKS